MTPTVYILSGGNDICSGHSHNNLHERYRQRKAEDAWKDVTWNEWSYIAMPSLNDNIIDENNDQNNDKKMLNLLLEDLLIILIKGTRNKTLNILQYNTTNSQRQNLIQFLAKTQNKHFQQIYRSHPFIEYLTGTALPHNFQHKDLSVIDIINSQLLTIHIGEPVQQSYWYKPPIQADRVYPTDPYVQQMI